MMKVGVLTSGGDSPGMNACLRAIVRVGISRGLSIFGMHGGLQGLLDRSIFELTARDVSNIVHRGGTFLTTGRSAEFRTEEGQKKAARILTDEEFDGLLALGGNGTMQAMTKLCKLWDGLIIGLPGTIDNDIQGTDYTIGFDTAVNNAVNAIDKIRDTAQAFDRTFLIEVMGRDSGHIAVHVGISCGAEAIAVPETPTDLNEIATIIKEGRARGKTFAFIIVAEGDEEGDARTIAKKLSDATGENCRVSVLGYIQRGGNPTQFDRILGTKLGAYAVECLKKGISGVMVGEMGGELVLTQFEDTWSSQKGLDLWLLGLVDELSI
ncbi:MAG: 6-phosphofructokinase [Candidatus Thorarchaeota archaeon]|nr:MAG: 6-phosphofructokinase [Candidatus Thorarchaeota archaeon]